MLPIATWLPTRRGKAPLWPTYAEAAEDDAEQVIGCVGTGDLRQGLLGQAQFFPGEVAGILECDRALALARYSPARRRASS